MTESLQRVEIYGALNKPNLIFGCDRELILMSGVIAFALVFSGMTIVSTVVGIILLLFNVFSCASWPKVIHLCALFLCAS